MNSRDFIRLAPQTAIDAALSIDAEALSTTPVLYKKENVDVYDIAINIWLLCVKDFAPNCWVYILTRITKYGLADTVKYFTDAALSWLNGEELQEYTLAYNLYLEIQNSFSHRTTLTHEYHTIDTPAGVFLFLCRFLKRLTPLKADILDKEAITSFWSNQKRLKSLCRKGYPSFLINLCRSEVDTGILQRRAKAYSNILMKDIEISPGTCYSLEGKPLRCEFDKVESLIKDYNFNRIEVWRSSVWDYDLGNRSMLTTVPKTFSSARTIAPEQCLRQAVAHRMFSEMGNTFPGINLEDQSVNQRYAQIGSETGQFCTIDLSHASDDVTWLLVQEIFSEVPEYTSYLNKIRPRYINVEGDDRLLQSFATMGNSMTFLVESEIFYIISLAAVHFAQRHGEQIPDTVIVYGDDIIVPTPAYPYVTAFLSSLGFNINESKSFADGVFRESCGKDYLAGVDVTSPYFPRQSLKTLLNWTRNRNSQLVTTAESLISMQHRLMDVSRIAAQYIELYIKEHKGDLGYMPIGTLSTDLWGYDLIPYKERFIPSYQRMDVPTENPWVFREGKWRYSPIKTKYVRSTDPNTGVHVMLQCRPTVDLEKKSLPDDILYLQYLAHGPLYEDSLMRLLGISTSRRSRPTGRPRSAWKLFEI